MNLPRDKDHRDFPLSQWSQGKYWGRYINGRHVRFGVVSTDPTGAIAWQLYEAEREAWERGDNPRRGPRRLAQCLVLGRLKPAWLLAGPLAQVGIAVIDAERRRLMCLHCYRTWTITYFKGDIHRRIQKRMLQCAQGCSQRPWGEIRDAINLALRPEEIEAATYVRLVEAKREGWHTAPQNIDATAAAEGAALQRLALLALKLARRQRKQTYGRHELIGGAR